MPTVAGSAAVPAVSSGVCGSTLLAGPKWLGGLGVDVKSNGADQGSGTSCGGTSYVNHIKAGYEWQCTELVDRLYLTRGWITSSWYGNGGDSSPTSHDSMYDRAPASLAKQPNGSISYVGPGDVVSVNEYDNGAFFPDGHVLIVNAAKKITSGTINLVSQNFGSPSDAIAMNTATLSGGTLTLPSSGGWSYAVIGVVHAPVWTSGEAAMPANGSGNAPPGMPSLACPTAASCAAAGSYDVPALGLLVGGPVPSWQATQAPLPANATGGTLSSVACPTATRCVAVGLANVPGSNQAWILTGARASWQSVNVPVPANASTPPDAELTGVTCPSATSCVATGVYYPTTNASGDGLLLTGAGTSWTPVEAPLPPNVGADWGIQLQSVACPSTTTCVAVGMSDDPNSGNEQGLLVTGSGTSPQAMQWQAIEAPLPANAAAKPSVQLFSVTCPSTASCTATGDYFDSSDNEHGLLVTGSGSSWQATQAPLPAQAAGAPYAWLNHEACRSATSCTATGTYFDSSGNGHAFLVTGSGTTWNPVTVPLPAGAAASRNFLYAVACQRNARCLAAGTYTDSSGTAQALLMSGSGTSWRSISTPLPVDANPSGGAQLTSAACPSTTWCVATGSYATMSGQQILTETGLP
jgi:hypothetical protein